MKEYIKIKSLLLDACSDFVDSRLATVNDIIKSNQTALNSETKSSAGDKHETGRAMLQLEMEKTSQQLASINQMKTIVSKIDLGTTDVATLGSLVITNHHNYFLAISAGEIVLDTSVYYAISTNSPIGHLLLGKKVGEIVNFKNRIEIIDIQ